MPEIPYDDLYDAPYDDLFNRYPMLDTSQHPHADALLTPMTCDALQPLTDRDLLTLDPCLSISTVTAESVVAPSMSTFRKFGTPSREFLDMFPKGTLPALTMCHCLLELLHQQWTCQQAVENANWDVMYINTLVGVVKMRTDAWTPEMVICLNRIVNAHAQLLAQVTTPID